jgi:hypothetical protein
MNFLTLLDENHIFWFDQWYRFLSATQENPRFIVIDISKRKDNALSAHVRRHPMVIVDHWPRESWVTPRWVQDTDFDYFHPTFSFIDQLKYFRRRWQHRLTGRAKPAWLIDKQADVERRRFALSLWANQPRFFRKWLAELNEELTYVDGDALPLRSLKHLYEADFDIAFTTERPENVRIGREPEHVLSRPVYPYRAINVGIYCTRPTSGAFAFLDAWMATMETVKHDLLDQTAAAWLILQGCPDFFAHQGEALPVEMPDGKRVMVGNIPGDIYNCHSFELSMLAPDATQAVFHFVGAHKRSDKLPQLTVALDNLYSQITHGHGK